MRQWLLRIAEDVVEWYAYFLLAIVIPLGIIAAVLDLLGLIDLPPSAGPYF